MSITFADIAGAKVGRACDLSAHGFEYCRDAVARARRIEMMEDLFPIAFVAITVVLVVIALYVVHRQIRRRATRTMGPILSAPPTRPARRTTLVIGG